MVVDVIDMDSERINQNLIMNGFAHIKGVKLPDIELWIQSAGSIIESVHVRHVEGRDKSLFSNDDMELHTDHPDVDIISWFCISQAENGGASRLFDFKKLIDSLTEVELDVLRETKVRVPAADGSSMETRPLLSSSGIYFAPWLIRCIDQKHKKIAGAIMQRIQNIGHEEILLNAGDAIIVNNKRVLHGRASFKDGGAKRDLIRHWVSSKILIDSNNYV